MEKAGFVRLLDRLTNQNLKIRAISTDRHNQIRKIMKTTYPDIKHQIDPWHTIKGLEKKLSVAAKKKGCEIIGKHF